MFQWSHWHQRLFDNSSDYMKVIVNRTEHQGHFKSLKGFYGISFSPGMWQNNKGCGFKKTSIPVYIHCCYVCVWFRALSEMCKALNPALVIQVTNTRVYSGSQGHRVSMYQLFSLPVLQGQNHCGGVDRKTCVLQRPYMHYRQPS